MKPALQVRLNQQLALTPQLQQAIRLLQLSQLELEAELRQIAEGNPMLELGEDQEDAESEAEAIEREHDGELYAAAPATNNTSSASVDDVPDDTGEWADGGGEVEIPVDFAGGGVAASGGNYADEDFEPQNTAAETLQQHLLWQLNMAGFNPRQQAIATVLIDALNLDGYLQGGLEPVLAALPARFAASVAEIEAVRRRLQGFDPLGVGSLDLQDCLRMQLEQFAADTPQRDLAIRLVDSELDLLARNDIARLARKLHASEEDTAAAAQLIRSLNPRPGAVIDTTPVEYVAPDAYASKQGTRWVVSLNPDCQPRLGLNQHYCGLIAKARGQDASWMRGQLQEARWLIKSLESRAETLLKVATEIVRRQSAFLDYGPEAMHPLVLREVAEEVGMHESTISRVTTRKYLHTPRGTFELKYFFSSGVSTEDGGNASATAIQAMLRKLIDAEDPRRPLSDQSLSKTLNSRGIQVARRTVAKYREGLRIPSSSERQRAR